MLYVILIAICAVVIFIACLKFPKVGKWLIIGVVGIAFLVLTIRSCVSLIEYNNAQSTTHGSYEDLLKINQDNSFESGNYVVEICE